MIVKFQSREKLEECVLASLIRLGYSIGIETIINAYFPTNNKAKEWYTEDFNMVSLSMFKVMSSEKHLRIISLKMHAKILWPFLLNIEEFYLSKITHLKDNHVESFIRETCLLLYQKTTSIFKMLSAKGLCRDQNNFIVRDSSKVIIKLRKEEVVKNNLEFKDSIMIRQLNRMNDDEMLEYMKQR